MPSLMNAVLSNAIQKLSQKQLNMVKVNHLIQLDGVRKHKIPSLMNAELSNAIQKLLNDQLIHLGGVRKHNIPSLMECYAF